MQDFRILVSNTLDVFYLGYMYYVENVKLLMTKLLFSVLRFIDDENAIYIYKFLFVLNGDLNDDLIINDVKNIQIDISEKSIGNNCNPSKYKFNILYLLYDDLIDLTMLKAVFKYNILHINYTYENEDMMYEIDINKTTYIDLNKTYQKHKNLLFNQLKLRQID